LPAAGSVVSQSSLPVSLSKARNFFEVRRRDEEQAAGRRNHPP
jgi:hypothetical protein